jgi:hypothetical protein
MAEVDPLTGSPLSRENRNSFFSSSRVSSSSFRGTDIGYKTEIAEQSKKFAEAQQQNQTTLTGIQQQFQSLQNQINTLSQNIANVYKLIQADTQSEQNLLAKEQKQEVQSTQRKIRIDSENQLEQKIRNAISAPIQALSNKVENIFGNVANALTSLFLGWLGLQGIKALNAWRNKDEKALNDIKNSLLSNIGIGVGVIASIKFGLGLVKTAIGAVIRTVTSLTLNAIKLPFKAAGAAAAGLGSMLSGGKKSPPSPASPKPSGGSGGRGPGIFGGMFSAIGAGMNLKSGEYADAATNALGFAPGPIGGAARLASFADEMVESFAPGFRGGAGIIGNTPRGGNKPPEAQPQQPKVQDLKVNSPQPSGTDSKNTPPNLPANMESIAESKTPPKQKESTEESKKLAESTPTSAMIPSGQNQTLNISMKENEKKEKYEPKKPMMPESKELAFIPEGEKSKEEKYWESERDYWNMISDGLKKGMTYEELELTQDEIDYLEGKTDTPPFLMETEKMKVDTSKLQQITAKPDMIQAKPSTPPAMEPPKEPPPNVIVSSAPQQKPTTPPMSPTVTDVPLISSSNPDNFYVLYSQLNYNVVM